MNQRTIIIQLVGYLDGSLTTLLYLNTYWLIKIKLQWGNFKQRASEIDPDMISAGTTFLGVRNHIQTD